MEIDEELQPAADLNAEQQSEAEGKPPVVGGESGAPEVVETDEQKNARVQEEASEKARLKEEKRQASVQRRMDELTADKYAERKRADELAGRLAALESKQNTPQAPGEPTRDQFENYEDFVTARAEFRAVAKAEAATAAAIAKFSETQKESQTRSVQEESRRATEKQFIERRLEVEKSIPDYKEVMADWEPNIPDSAVDLLVKMADGPLITYHLAKNPSLEAQFRDQPAYMHGILLGQLSATLKSPTKVTAAPTPGKTVSTAKGGTSTEPPSDPNQYYAWAQKNLR